MTDLNRFIVIYDPVTKMIRSTVDQPYPQDIFTTYDALMVADPNFVYLEVEKPEDGIHALYVDGSTLSVRGHMTVTTSLNAVVGGSLVIGDIPTDTTIILDGVETTNGSETEIEIEFDTPGSYEVKLIKLPFLPKIITVEVPAP